MISANGEVLGTVITMNSKNISVVFFCVPKFHRPEQIKQSLLMFIIIYSFITLSRPI